jgi:hypothetical protein
MNAALVVQGLEQGKSNLEISRETGTHRQTIAKMRELLEKARGVEFLCRCGQPATHLALCEFRRGPRQRLQEKTEKFFRTLQAATALKK